MARFYRLAHGTRPVSGGYPWPYDVSVCFDEGVLQCVAMTEGVAHGAAGGVFTAAETLRAVWDDHCRNADGRWLRPYLERMAAGEPVAADEVVAHYTMLHGVEPEWYGTG